MDGHGGLDIENHTILEIACIITDCNLNIISEEFEIVINHPDVVLENMNEWSKIHHAQSGLTHDCKCSNITLKEAEQMLLNFLKKYIPKGICPLAGNTIYMDRLFLIKHMPLVHDYLHYRIIDVSSLKELVRRWNSLVYENAPKKQLNHRSLSDVKESIQELKYYKEHFFKSSNQC
ncbi:putative oligoribonuclease isoform X2 [Nomia melanderi]|uniref:putative oligoribonuclease isoform X2 n=1 Tax=Nomia melanderi TaxID=2448451 RepID=UPI0013046C9D|nr:probable oligoribonuclease isoform X2 [Nomia melanderi]XP_031839358.1 probable oligoribonuclease isoform X2 [Nomia melanderi]XP_031839359.1 probable oligoribonuclease isoform X2 [Nomia melanderi]XP_031839360.1 probable oligoribonuclease isoform X2 [Nomia melanderi]XP_031839361.1 probable oligoribonuclease isoform X2 [Nomia melanderi]